MGLDTHETAALYVTDALRGDERRCFELHVVRCDQCRADLTRLAETAAALAFAIEPVEPPPALRQRVIEAAHAARQP